MNYENRVRQLESEGMTRSDAQAVADAEIISVKTETKYYECGICGYIHQWNFNGDCRDDNNRLTYDDMPDNFADNVLTWDDRLQADWESFTCYPR